MLAKVADKKCCVWGKVGIVLQRQFQTKVYVDLYFRNFAAYYWRFQSVTVTLSTPFTCYRQFPALVMFLLPRLIGQRVPPVKTVIEKENYFLWTSVSKICWRKKDAGSTQNTKKGSHVDKHQMILDLLVELLKLVKYLTNVQFKYLVLRKYPHQPESHNSSLNNNVHWMPNKCLLESNFGPIQIRW